MKKLISLMGAVSLIVGASSTVIACQDLKLDLEFRFGADFNKFVEMNTEDLQKAWLTLQQWMNANDNNQGIFTLVMSAAINNDGELPENINQEIFQTIYNFVLEWYSLTIIMTNDKELMLSLQFDIKKQINSPLISEVQIKWLIDIDHYIDERADQLEPLPPVPLHPKLEGILALSEEEFTNNYNELSDWFHNEENEREFLWWIYIILDSNLTNIAPISEEDFYDIYPVYVEYFLYWGIATDDLDDIFNIIEHLETHLLSKFVNDDQKALVISFNEYLRNKAMGFN